jgi:hypothetical protein
VAWWKPKTCPLWLAQETVAALPEALVLREVHDRLGTPGFRTREITLVTTLLSPEVYHVSDLAEPYRRRWQVEVCQTQPVNLSWCPLRRAPWTISDLRGFVKRERVIDVDLLGRHHDFANQR